MESLFEEFDPSKAYGGYWPSGSTEHAYRAVMVERAIRTDDVAMLDECIRRGWLTPECLAFDNTHVVDYCDRRGLFPVP